MGPVKIKHVVSFTSQDPKYPVDNLLLEEGHHPWLSCPQDRSRLLKAELQLEQASHIAYIDIGNCGSAFLQVDVGRSSWPADQSYCTLLPTTALMMLADAKLDKNRSGVRMFKGGDFLATALGEKWDRIRLTCSQPFNRHAQFGLSFIQIRTPLDDGSSKAHLPSSPAQAPPDPTARQGLSSAGFLRTFFPEVPSGSVEEAALKSRLRQLEPAASPGRRRPACLSRPAQMVLKAAGARKRALPLLGSPSLPATESNEQARISEDVAQSLVVSRPRQEFSTRRDQMKTRRRKRPCPEAGRSLAASSVGVRLGSRREGRGRKGRWQETDGEKELEEEDGPDRAAAGVSTCPICDGRFPISVLPVHASSCGEEFGASSASSPSSWAELPDVGVCCPICQSHFAAAEVEAHASSCGDPLDRSPSWLWGE